MTPSPYTTEGKEMELTTMGADDPVIGARQENKVRLTPAQRKKLEFLTDEWREEPEDWKSGALFGRLEAMGYCEMESRRLSGGDVLTGPGSWGMYRWFTRRTEAGRHALAAASETASHRDDGSHSRTVVSSNQKENP